MNRREAAIENGDVEEIEKIFKSKTELFSPHDFNTAILCGRFSSLKKLFDLLGCRNWLAPVAAAAVGNLDMFEFLHKNEFKITLHCASQAALYNHPHILRYILNNNLPVDWRANANARFANAVESSHVLVNSPIDKHAERSVLQMTHDTCAQQGLYHANKKCPRSSLYRLFYFLE